MRFIWHPHPLTHSPTPSFPIDSALPPAILSINLSVDPSSRDAEMPTKRKKTNRNRRPASVPLPETPPGTTEALPFSPSSPSVPYTPADVVQRPLTIITEKDRPIELLTQPAYNLNLPPYLPRNISFWQLLDSPEPVLKTLWEAVIRMYIGATRDDYHRNLLGQARR